MPLEEMSGPKGEIVIKDKEIVIKDKENNKVWNASFSLKSKWHADFKGSFRKVCFKTGLLLYHSKTM